jgi:hypothetical protein
MEARLLRVGLIVATILSLGASHRTRNFMATAATPDLAHQVCEEAERFRRELAVEWLGRELPPWTSPCPIRVKTAPNMGAGGATSFTFANGYPSDWQMEVFGSRERVLDSVLPHEVMHTVFATHFRRPLPRWADEGACTTVEDRSERSKHDTLLIRFLTTGKGIPFNRMFAMKDYPPEMLPLYAQGYSVARFLIAQGGKPKFVQFVGEGMQTENWNAAVRKHYSFKNLSELQLTWVDWVGKGSPKLDADTLLAGLTPVTKDTALQSPDDNSSTPPRDLLAVSEPARQQLVDVEDTHTPVQNAVWREGEGSVRLASQTADEELGWYARQRDQARAGRSGRAAMPSEARSGRERSKPGDHELMERRDGRPLPNYNPTSAGRGGTILR